jgi:hypothetical protein
MVPADQCLKSDQLLRLGVDQRLEDQVELLAPNGLAQVLSRAHAVVLFRLELR